MSPIQCHSSHPSAPAPNIPGSFQPFPDMDLDSPKPFLSMYFMGKSIFFFLFNLNFLVRFCDFGGFFLFSRIFVVGCSTLPVLSRKGWCWDKENTKSMDLSWHRDSDHTNYFMGIIKISVWAWRNNWANPISDPLDQPFPFPASPGGLGADPEHSMILISCQLMGFFLETLPGF